MGQEKAVQNGMIFAPEEESKAHEPPVIMIGMVLLHVHKPRNDASFPEALRSLPIF